MVNDTLQPGWPGRGYDPTGGFSDLQWYMYHQGNVAYFAAFSAHAFDAETALVTARGIVRALPHLGEGYRGSVPGRLPGDDRLRRIISLEDVDDFDGFPDRWLDRGNAVASDPDLPLFRVSIARRSGGRDEEGRRSFLMVQLCHSFAEGNDSAALSRSHSAEHRPVAASASATRPRALAARAFARFAVVMQLIVGRLWTPHPGPIHIVSRAYPRRAFIDLAHRIGVGQRALFMALAAHVMADAGHSAGKPRRFSTAYSSLDTGGSAERDPFMRMRMLFANLQDAPDFASLARSVEQILITGEASERGFNAELNVVATRVHRRLARRIPWAYAPRVFAFMPYDFIFALLPPHRLTGPLAAGLLEPVFAGASMPGVVGCVVVPGRHMVSFNFAIEEARMADVGRLDRLLEALKVDFSAESEAAAQRSAAPVNTVTSAAVDHPAVSGSIENRGKRGESD